MYDVKINLAFLKNNLSVPLTGVALSLKLIAYSLSPMVSDAGLFWVNEIS